MPPPYFHDNLIGLLRTDSLVQQSTATNTQYVLTVVFPILSHTIQGSVRYSILFWFKQQAAQVARQEAFRGKE